MNSDQKERIIRDEMARFLDSNGIPFSDNTPIDDVLIDYFVSVLDDFSTSLENDRSENLDECLDLDALTEMMASYIPDFASVNPSAVQDWIFTLIEQFRRAKEVPKPSSSSSSEKASFWQMPRSRSESEQEPSSSSVKASTLDEETKEQILRRFAFVPEKDDADGNAERKTLPIPQAKTDSAPKNVRYLDGKVVSTKGEKFVEIKKEGEEDRVPKGTYLKAARKYRFH